MQLTNDEAVRLCAALGDGWTFEATVPADAWNAGTYMRGPGEQCVRVVAPGSSWRPLTPEEDDGTQRLSITAAFEGELYVYWCRHTYYKRDFSHEITVARKRGPEVWAKEIARRVLPLQLIDIADVRRDKLAEDNYATRMSALVSRMHASATAAGVALVPVTRSGEQSNSLGFDWHQRPKTPEWVNRYFDMDVTVSLGSQDQPDRISKLDLRDIPVELADAILKLVGESLKSKGE